MIIERLKQALNTDLPGVEAQKLMAPIPLTKGIGPVILPDVPQDARRNGVLLSLTGDSIDNLEFLLTLRSSKLPSHAGQLSLPGGGIEAGESPEHTALREAREEVGLRMDTDDLLGHLTPIFVPHSYNFIHTWIGWTPERQPLKLQQDEVEEAFYVPVRHLLDISNLKSEIWNLRGMQMEVPYWDVHKVPLWGATAMILSEFVELVKMMERV